MNKAELIDVIAKKVGLTKADSGKALDAITGAITQALSKGEKVQLIGFGSFEVRKRKARSGRNPQTGAALKIPAAKVPVFKAGKKLRLRANR